MKSVRKGACLLACQFLVEWQQKKVTCQALFDPPHRAYAALTGTPIVSAADVKLLFAGRGFDSLLERLVRRFFQ